MKKNTHENKLLSFQGKIHLIKNDRELLAIKNCFKSIQVLGFDTETRPSFKKGDVYKVALLQLATETDAFLIRLQYLSKFQIIIDILENSEIVKVGVAIRDDLKALQEIFKFEPQNFIELQTLAKAKGLQKLGLKTMTEEILNGTISKGPKLTNWENKVLSQKQRTYAATDAWIGLKLYQKIDSL